ncbi:NAD-dependent succinate-semialdehyde dehydrogenase [Cryptosporangium sp. NPDC051539]|uniref:NAD-dependent succinate-semialdehyde dehydrogenase n=1 Tax=Cryptosporangium sp. NPDC051539 TaxID=3363962 RepID=UPI0037B7A26A
MTDLSGLNPERGVVIAGRRRKGGSGLFDVDDPATGAHLAAVADGDRRDALAAVDAAAAAFDPWRRTPGRTRSEVLRRVFELMVRDADRLAGLIAAENGKSLADARGEVVYAAEFFRWFAEEAARSGGSYGPSPAGGTRTLVTERPVGVAALVTPWNFPAAMAARKIAPALAAGCTVVLKPAAETPLTAIALLDLLAEAGVPDGVVNLVPTTDPAGVVEAWLADPRVRKISFTGSTRVGQLLLRRAADRIVNASMELGGNAPFVVTEDADLEAAVDGAMVAKFRGGGQACTAANRFYVHQEVVERFTALLGARLEALAVGPASAGSDIGPLISAKAVGTVGGLVDRAVAAGAWITHRAPVPSDGYFYPPTALRLPDSASVPTTEILGTEIFGPVAPIVAWTDEDAMLRDANASELGLAAYVYAGDLARAVRIGEELEAGMIGVNRGLVSDPSAPFGGMKQSGIGREGARVGLEEFTETQYLSVDWPNGR